MSKQDYKGRALITGASTGLGAVYADRLARRGYDLILVARDSGRLKELADRIVRETGRKVDVLAADLTSKPDLLRVEERLRTDSSITALVNNAGSSVAGTLVESNADALEAMIQLNIVAPTRLARAAVPGFVERGSGTIINIASILALIPEMLNGVYSGTKAFVLNLTQSLNEEVGPKGVRVQAVLPGAIRTEFWDRAGMSVTALPEEMVMTADNLVDAALAGLDQQELVTIPSLPDAADWERFNSARKAMQPNLSRQHAAERYKRA